MRFSNIPPLIPIFIVGMIILINIFETQNNNRKKIKVTDYRKMISNRINMIDRKLNLVLSTMNTSTIKNSKRIIDDNVSALLKEKRLSKKVKEYYQGEFQIEYYEQLNNRILELCDVFENQMKNRSIRQATFIKNISSLNQLLETTVLNYDIVRNHILYLAQEYHFEL